MDYAAILQGLVAKWPILALIFMVLGTLLVIGQAVVPLTPTKKDDAAWEKIKGVPVLGHFLAALELFAIIHKK